MTLSSPLMSLILAGAVLVLLAVAAILSATASRKKKEGEAPTAKSFSWLAGFAFWLMLGAVGAFGAGLICNAVLAYADVVIPPAHVTEELALSSAINAAVAIVLAGLALLLSFTSFAVLRGRPDRYGLGVSALTLLVSVLILAASLPQALDVKRRGTSTKAEITPDPVKPPD